MPACIRATATFAGRSFGAATQTRAGRAASSNKKIWTTTGIESGTQSDVALVRDVQNGADTCDEHVHLFFLYDIRGHQINSIAQWPEQQPAVQRVTVKLARERRIRRLDFE